MTEGYGNVQVGIQEHLNRNLNDITETHGDLGAFDFIETFNGSQHLDVAACGSDKVNDHPRTGVAG